MRALVIEDNDMTAILTEYELWDIGFTSVDTASTEEEAIEAVTTRSPDLVTSDGSLLMGSGLSAVKRIRACLPVPVIFITGDPIAAEQSLPSAPVIEKPFTAAQFMRAVEQATAGTMPC